MSEAEKQKSEGEQKGEEEAAITLRISCPGGRKVTVDVHPATTTVHDLKVLIEHNNGPPAGYTRLLCRGKKLDDEDATLSNLNIPNRTALMALHNEHYAQDQDGIAAIEKILAESDELKDENVDARVVHERVTQLCCKLDAVDTNGSTTLRQYRKAALARVQALDRNHMCLS